MKYIVYIFSCLIEASSVLSIYPHTYPLTGCRITSYIVHGKITSLTWTNRTRGKYLVYATDAQSIPGSFFIYDFYTRESTNETVRLQEVLCIVQLNVWRRTLSEHEVAKLQRDIHWCINFCYTYNYSSW